eukprot:1488716-Karenia_brevis.AAC.1
MRRQGAGAAGRAAEKEIVGMHEERHAREAAAQRRRADAAELENVRLQELCGKLHAEQQLEKLRDGWL